MVILEFRGNLQGRKLKNTPNSEHISSNHDYQAAAGKNIRNNLLDKFDADRQEALFHDPSPIQRQMHSCTDTTLIIRRAF